MVFDDEKALKLIEEWQQGSYQNETQKKAALQVKIIEALKQKERETLDFCRNSLRNLKTYNKTVQQIGGHKTASDG